MRLVTERVLSGQDLLKASPSLTNHPELSWGMCRRP
jgi:hypothetical protein